MTKSTKPNFFIIGAPKCGTTALSQYLNEHPNIFISSPKEPHYFAEDFEQYRLVKSQAEYLNLFAKCNQNCLQAGEASVFYLYSTVALQQISQFDPEAKIIVMLRNPLDLVYSFHSQLLYTADENEPHFETAWKLQKSRQKKLNLPQRCRAPKLLQYASLGKLGQQMEKLLSIFPSQQVEIILFDDFINSTKKVYDRVVNFLEIPDDNRVDFPVVNGNKVHRWKWMGDFLVKPPKHVVAVSTQVKRLLGVHELPLMAQIRAWNSKAKQRNPLSKNFRQELLGEFEEDIQTLAQIIDRDLNHWLISQ